MCDTPRPYEIENRRILALLSGFLNETPDYIRPDMIASLQDCGVDAETAFSLLLAAAMGLDMENADADKALYHAYFPQMIRRMRYTDYTNNPYLRTVRFRDTSLGRCTLTHETVPAYEAFVFNDILCESDGRQIPQIGFFEREFRYPALLEDGRLWMSVTPNEVNTMAAPVAEARGRVLAFGLGLGYFAYMAAEKEEVASVTVVEQNPDVIALFTAQLLPRFPNRHKLRIVQDDAFTFAAAHYPEHAYDFCFTDLWHDVSDGLPLYLRMKALAPLAPDAVHRYWIEPTLQCYL